MFTVGLEVTVQHSTAQQCHGSTAQCEKQQARQPEAYDEDDWAWPDSGDENDERCIAALKALHMMDFSAMAGMNARSSTTAACATQHKHRHITGTSKESSRGSTGNRSRSRSRSRKKAAANSTAARSRKASRSRKAAKANNTIAGGKEATTEEESVAFAEGFNFLRFGTRKSHRIGSR